MKANILGTDYEIETRALESDKRFEGGDVEGYCGLYEKKIVIGELATFPAYKDCTKKEILQAQNAVLRHEITHAFLFESGLDCCAAPNAWAANEEVVDWIALQGPKIYKAWRETGCA